MIEVLFKKLYEDVEIPQYAYPGDSGFDIVVHNFKKLYSAQAVDPDGEQIAEDVKDFNEIYGGKIILSPHSRLLVGAGYSVAIRAEFYELQIRSRSGLALKQGLVVCNAPGTVDNQYRGEIGVILLNTSAFHITIKKGDRVAQGVFNQISPAIFTSVDHLPETKRGIGGYGSTDK